MCHASKDMVILRSACLHAKQALHSLITTTLHPPILHPPSSSNTYEENYIPRRRGREVERSSSLLQGVPFSLKVLAQGPPSSNPPSSKPQSSKPQSSILNPPNLNPQSSILQTSILQSSILKTSILKTSILPPPLSSNPLSTTLRPKS